MAITIKRINTTQTINAVSIGEYQIIVDMPASDGGSDNVPGPHDLYDAALGACKNLTVLWYAKKKGIPVENVSTRVDRDSSDERKGTYRLNAVMHVTGNLTDEQVKELALAAEKCPVHKLMTTVTTEITTSMEHSK